MQDILQADWMGLGYVYMDLPYGNKKERMEPRSALCWKIRTRPSELMAARSWQSQPGPSKSLHFHQNIHVRQSGVFKQRGGNLWKIMKRGCLFLFVFSMRAPLSPRAPCAHSASACVWLLSIKGQTCEYDLGEWFVSMDEDNYKD